jgi:hypothetical protein
MLLKLIHRLHHPGESAWAAWVRDSIDLATMTGEVAGARYRDLEELLLLEKIA